MYELARSCCDIFKYLPWLWECTNSPINMLVPMTKVNKIGNNSFHLFLHSDSNLNQKWLSLSSIRGSTSELPPVISFWPISWSNSCDVAVTDNYIWMKQSLIILEIVQMIIKLNCTCPQFFTHRLHHNECEFLYRNDYNYVISFWKFLKRISKAVATLEKDRFIEVSKIVLVLKFYLWIFWNL